MNTVQEIKARWEAEVKATKSREKAVRAKTRKGKVNLALRRAGIPLRVL